MTHKIVGPKPVHRVRPVDPKLQLFDRALDFVQAFAPLHFILGAAWSLLFLFAPGVPKTLHDPARSRTTRAGLWWGSGLAFLFCFVVTLIWSCSIGKFSGTEQGRLYFLHDITNIIEYFILCPVYVGLTVHFLILLVANWERLSRPPGMVITKAPRLPHAHGGIGVFLILSISSMGAVNFIKDELDPAKFEKIGWWVDRVENGARVLSSLGIYYALLNFALLAVCVTAAIAFVSFLLLCVGFGQIIAQQPVTNEIDIEAIREILSEFNEAYVVLKLLAATLILNAWVWDLDLPRGSMNVQALNVALMLFGVVLISVPRYYIELEWFHFRERRTKALGAKENRETDDMRSCCCVRSIALAADGLVLSTFAGGIFHILT